MIIRNPIVPGKYWCVVFEPEIYASGSNPTRYISIAAFKPRSLYSVNALAVHTIKALSLRSIRSVNMPRIQKI